MLPHRVRRRLAIVRQPFMAAAGGDDRKAGCARPIDEFASQAGLVAIGEAVDHAGVARLACEQRTAKGVGLDGDVDEMLAVTERRQRVLHRRGRISGAFDDDIDTGMRHQRLPVVADMRASALDGVVEGRCRELFLGPADPREIGLRIRRSKIDDPRQMNAGHARHLRQIHRSEFAGADQSDAQGFSGQLALAQFAEEIHDRSAFSVSRIVCRDSSGTSAMFQHGMTVFAGFTSFRTNDVRSSLQMT